MRLSNFNLFLLLPAIRACLHYQATMPFDDSIPFVATVMEDLVTRNVTLCSIKQTYKEHDLYQILRNQFPDPDEKRKDERGDGDKSTWGFKRWDFTCVRGVRGWVSVGLRSVVVIDERLGIEKGKRKDMVWVSDVKEDVWGEKFVFTKHPGCETEKEKEEKKEKERKAKLEKERLKKQAAQASLTESERKKEEAKEMIIAAIGEREDKEKVDGKDTQNAKKGP